MVHRTNTIHDDLPRFWGKTCRHDWHPMQSNMGWRRAAIRRGDKQSQPRAITAESIEVENCGRSLLSVRQTVSDNQLSSRFAGSRSAIPSPRKVARPRSSTSHRPREVGTSREYWQPIPSPSWGWCVSSCERDGRVFDWSMSPMHADYWDGNQSLPRSIDVFVSVQTDLRLLVITWDLSVSSRRQ